MKYQKVGCGIHMKTKNVAILLAVAVASLRGTTTEDGSQRRWPHQVGFFFCEFDYIE